MDRAKATPRKWMAAGRSRTHEWLEALGRSHPAEPLADYCHTLAEELSREWQRLGLASVLEIFVSGVEGAEVRF